jgi:hypothetical protein
VSEHLDSELPDDHDVIIWHLPDRDELDVYRVTKGSNRVSFLRRRCHAFKGLQQR